MMYRHKVTDYLPDLFNELRRQLKADQGRWGDEWKRRAIDGQSGRVVRRINEYFQEHATQGKEIPWLKVIGNAFIAWIREYEWARAQRDLGIEQIKEK